MQNTEAPDQLRADLQDFGLDPAAAQAWLDGLGEAPAVQDGAAGDEQPGDPLQVWPENWPALRAWLKLQTQWHLSPSGRLQGLRLDAAELTVARLLRGQPQAELDRVMDHLVEMEHAAVEALDG